jgi:hypothetical protein
MKRKIFYLNSVLIFVLLIFSFNVLAQSDERNLGLPNTPNIKTLPIKAKRFALIIGVDNYADTQISTLGGASNDAKTLADALIEYGGFDPEQVTLLASNQSLERQPTRGNILRRLSNLASAIPSDGLLLIFFAGHGVERAGQAFLLPSDAQVNNDVELLEQTAINVMQVKERVRKIGVKQVVMIVDACRNDPGGRADADNPLTPNYTKGFSFDTRNKEVSAFVTLYATEMNHRAYEYKEKHQGYFTWALVEGLKGAAANDKKEITLANLIKYLQDIVPKRVTQDLGKGKEQRPFAIIEGYKADDLVLAISTAKYDPKLAIDAQTNSTSLSQKTDKIEEPSNATKSTLEGTVWIGTSTISGKFTIEFLKENKYRYTISTGSRMGVWKQVGNYVQIDNGHSVSEGNIEGDKIKFKGSNIEGEEFKFTVTKDTSK